MSSLWREKDVLDDQFTHQYYGGQNYLEVMALLILSNRSKTDIESFSKNVAGRLVWAYLVRYASAIADLQETGVQPSYMSEVCEMEVELKAKDFFGYDTWATGTRGYLESMAKTLAKDVIQAQ